jgi:hypothetical protein
MSWMNQPFNDGIVQAADENISTESRPLKRSTVLLLLLPGLILFIFLIGYFIEEGGLGGIVGLSVYIILANVLTSKVRNLKWWNFSYWTTDIFLKIIFLPGRIIGSSFIMLYQLLRYNL